jgi:hypothetical protein
MAGSRPGGRIFLDIGRWKRGDSQLARETRLNERLNFGKKVLRNGRLAHSRKT